MKVNEGMKKALIIGGAGFVGKYLAEYLSRECGYQVRSTKMKQETLEPEGYDVVDMRILLRITYFIWQHRALLQYPGQIHN